MTRRPVPDHEKRQNVGIRLHPSTIQRLDEIATFFQKLREANPLLPFMYPETRTEVIEWMLRGEVLDVIQRAMTWNRLGTPDERKGDMAFLTEDPFWNILVTEVRHYKEAMPESWLNPELPPRSKKSRDSIEAKPSQMGASGDSASSRPAKKPRRS